MFSRAKEALQTFAFDAIKHLESDKALMSADMNTIVKQVSNALQIEEKQEATTHTSTRKPTTSGEEGREEGEGEGEGEKPSYGLRKYREDMRRASMQASAYRTHIRMRKDPCNDRATWFYYDCDVDATSSDTSDTSAYPGDGQEREGREGRGGGGRGGVLERRSYEFSRVVKKPSPLPSLSSFRHLITSVRAAGVNTLASERVLPSPTPSPPPSGSHFDGSHHNASLIPRIRERERREKREERERRERRERREKRERRGAASFGVIATEKKRDREEREEREEGEREEGEEGEEGEREGEEERVRVREDQSSRRVCVTTLYTSIPETDNRGNYSVERFFADFDATHQREGERELEREGGGEREGGREGERERGGEGFEMDARGGMGRLSDDSATTTLRFPYRLPSLGGVLNSTTTPSPPPPPTYRPSRYEREREELRMKFVVGVKRHVRSQRIRGRIGPNELFWLEDCCDRASHNNNEALDMWPYLESKLWVNKMDKRHSIFAWFRKVWYI